MASQKWGAGPEGRLIALRVKGSNHGDAPIFVLAGGHGFHNTRT